MRRQRLVLPVVVTVATALSALTLAPALADQPRDGSVRKPAIERFLKEMDTDGDGALSRAEIEAAQAKRVAEIDADKNGQISIEELKAAHERQRERWMQERLARHDADKDGVVSTEEFERARTWRMSRLDGDGDGVITAREMERAWHKGRRKHRHRDRDAH